MGGEPLVHELLDQPRPPERAPDVVSATLGLEVLDQLRVVRVARPGPLDFALDVLVGDFDATGLGDLREDHERLHALLGLGPELGVDVCVGLVDDLEVRGFVQALASQRRSQLVVHDLDLLVHQHVRQVDRGIGRGVLDDLVGEFVASPIQGTGLEPLAQLRL